MKIARLLALCLLMAGTAHAQESNGVAELNGEKVILSPDFTWRFDDSGGERCTPAGRVTTVCALPSKWTPTPGDPGFEPLWFQQGTDIRGTVSVLGGRSVTIPVTVKTVMRIINGDRGKDSDFGLSVEDTKAEIAGKKATTLTSVVGTGETRTYSFVFLDDGMVILVTTVEDSSFMYSIAHKAAHASFVNSISIAGAE